MGMKYVCREGPMAVGDTWYSLATQGDNATPGAIIIGSGNSSVKQILFAMGDNTPTCAPGSHGFILKLTGDALLNGEQLLNMGAITCWGVTAGPTGEPNNLFKYDVDIPLKTTGGQVQLNVCATLGTLWGQPEANVTLGYM